MRPLVPHEAERVKIGSSAPVVDEIHLKGRESSALREANELFEKLKGVKEIKGPKASKKISKFKKCRSCKDTIHGPKREIGTDVYHEFCLVCRKCKDVIEDEEDFILVHDKPCHTECAEHLKICVVCVEDIVGRGLLIEGKTYHRKCCKCTTCQSELTPKTATIFRDQICCPGCMNTQNVRIQEENLRELFENEKQKQLEQKHLEVQAVEEIEQEQQKQRKERRFIETEEGQEKMHQVREKERGSCASCQKMLEGSSIEALGRIYHSACFVCLDCHDVIDTEEGYSEHDGEPYHPTCYHERFGEKCTRCNKVMMEEIVKALEHTYHPECFCCRGCDVPIADSFFELDGYPVCENCQHPSPVPQSVSPDTNEEVPGPLCTATAAYPYEPTDSTQLPLEVGDRLFILQKDDDGWWLVTRNGQQGFIPGGFVIEDSPEEIREPRICPQCSFQNLANARFCCSCGHQL